MTAKILPVDQSLHAVQALSLGTSVSKITVTGTTARAALPTNAGMTDVVRVACNTDCYIVFGDSTVEADANDSLFTQGVEILAVPRGVTHVAAIQVSTNGVMTLTEML